MKVTDWGGVTPEVQSLFSQYSSSSISDQIQSAINVFRQLSKQYMGREPTSPEINGFMKDAFYSTFMAPGELTYPDYSSLAHSYLQDQLGYTQSDIAAQQKKRYEGQAGQYSPDVQSLFNDLLKRGASDAEVQHFGGLLASGQVDPYELRSFIQATPEYQTAQDTAFRGQLGQELSDLDTKAFGRQKEDVISRFANMGRTGSSSLDFALTDMMGKIAEQRQGFLANLSAQQYGGNKNLAIGDYQNYLNNMAQNNATNQARTWQTNDVAQQRGWEVSDYNRQYQDYMNALSHQKRTGMGSGLGTLLGTGIGAALAAPTGGMSIPVGAMLGGSLGGAGGGLYDYWR